jgi:hypothetical protein
MRRLSVLLVALLVVGVGVAVPASGVGTTAAEGTLAVTSAPGGPSQQTTEATDGNGTEADETAANGSVEPGARIAGVISVQGSEVSGEVASRALGERLRRAQSDRAKARVIAAQVNVSRERLRELRERKQRLAQAHENGSLSTGAYHARLARVTAEIRSVERLTDQTERTAAGLPAQTLDRQGVNASAIRALQSEVRNASGPETAAAARSIAGGQVGRGLDQTAANDSAAPGQSGDAPGHSEETDAADSDRSDGPPDSNAGDHRSGGPPNAGEETGANDASNASDDSGASDSPPSSANDASNASDATNASGASPPPSDDDATNASDGSGASGGSQPSGNAANESDDSGASGGSQPSGNATNASDGSGAGDGPPAGAGDGSSGDDRTSLVSWLSTLLGR